MSFLRRHPVLRTLLAIGSWATAVFGSLIAVLLLVVVIHELTSERVYEVFSEAVNPEMEGKLVRIHVSEIRAATIDEGGSPACNPAFQLAVFDALWVKADIRPPKPATGSIKIDTYRIGSYREHITEAHPLYGGAYELRLPESIMAGISEEAGTVTIPPTRVQLPGDLQARLKEITETHMVMEGNDHAPVHLHFSYQPSPLRKDLYMMGRQKGNCIEVQTLIRGQKAYEQQTREHALVSGDVAWALGLLLFSSLAATVAYFITRLCPVKSLGLPFLCALFIQVVLAVLLEHGI